MVFLCIDQGVLRCSYCSTVVVKHILRNGSLLFKLHDLGIHRPQFTLGILQSSTYIKHKCAHARLKASG